MGRIVLGEIKKLLSRRKVSLFILFLILLSCTYFGRMVVVEYGTNFSFNSYNQFVANIDKSNLVDEYEKRVIEQNNLLENPGENTKYTNSLPSEFSLYEVVLHEMEQVITYEEYIDSVVNNASKQSISLFNKDKFFNQNASKTIKDFSKLKEVDISFEGTYGVHLVTKSDFTEWIGIIIIVLLTISLITLEKEEQTSALLKSTPNGRRVIGGVKYCTGVCFTIILVIILYGFRLALIKATYGFGNSNSSIQSVLGFSSCQYTISIREYFIIYFLLKITVYISLFSLVFFIATILEHSWKTYVAIIVLIGLSASFTYTIGENDWLANLKWLNPIAFLNVEYSITHYKNMNIYSHPVSYIHIVVIGSIVVTLCTSALSIRKFNVVTTSYAVIRIRYIQKIKDWLYQYNSRKKRRAMRILIHTEIKKSWIHEKTITLFLLVIGIVWFTYTPMVEQLYTLRDIYYKQYVKEVEGEFTTEKLDFLMGKLEVIQEAKEVLKKNDTDLSQSVRNILEKKIDEEEGLQDAISYAKYLEKIENGHFVYSKGYQILLGSGLGKGELYKLNVFAIFVMIGLSIPIWGIEEWTGMKRILNISYRGRSLVPVLKYMNILICGVATFAIIFLPWIYNVSSAYRMGQWGISVVNIQEMSSYPKGVSIGIIVVLFYLLHLVYLWLVGIGIKYINGRMKSFSLTAVVVVAVFIIPVLVWS